MKKLTAKIREVLARRKAHWRVLQNSKARLTDLLDGLDSADHDLDRKLERLETLRKEDRRPEEREDLNEEIDVIRGAKDQMLERIADRREKNPRLAKRIAKDSKRIGELKARRKKMLVDAQDQIGRFWHLREFDCRDGTNCPDYMKDDLDGLAVRVLDKLRVKFGAGHVNSGYRTTSWNAAVGGEPNSYHIYDLRKSQPAADCTFATGSPSQWGAYARSLNVGGVGTYTTFVHLDSGPRRDWWG